MTIEYATRLRELVPDNLLPANISDFILPADGVIGRLFDNIYFTDYSASVTADGFYLVIDIVIPGELAFELPGLDGIKIVIGGTTPGATSITTSLLVGIDEFELRLDNIDIALRFPSSILKPMPTSPDAAPPTYAQIEMHGSIILDSNFDIRFEGFSALSLKPAMIGSSGVVISADDLKLDLSRTSSLPEVTSAGFDESFMGIYIGEAKVQLPQGLPSIAPKDLVLRNCAIGSGGVSGTLEAHYNPTYDKNSKTFRDNGAGEFFGIPFGLHDVKLTFKQNSLQESRMSGELLLPFFDKRLNVEIGINLEGGFAVKLTGVVEQGDSFDSSAGLLTLHKEGILDLRVDSIGFEVKDGIFTTKVSGLITPLLVGLKWPSFQVKELTIDSQGNVYLEGGWLDLPKQYTLDFHGFQMEITKLGFGKTEDGGKWIGFSGGLKLVGRMPAGASVEGLRIIWYDDGLRVPKITLKDVGVEFVVPNTLRFKGAVSYNELTTIDSKKIHRFDGDIKLKLISLDLEIDATLVIGSAESGPQGTYTFLAIYLGVERSAGIPLWATGLGLCGMAGLFALEMEPNKGTLPNDLHPASKVNEEWYENLDLSPGWYKRDPIGITNLRSKWDPHPNSLALGAGVTIGTLADNGDGFSGKMLLAVVFPGPILLIEGKANLLKKRSKLDDKEEDPKFRALAVLDNRARTFLFGLDAQYKYRDKGGELIDIRGGAKAFFDFNDANAWYLHLGEKEPREKRIRAKMFYNIFEANAYLMLDASQLAMG